MQQTLPFNPKFLLISAGLLLTFSAFAQAIEVRGKVTDEYKEPLIGASVIIKGTSIGIACDVNGVFLIKTNLGSTLKFSYDGYNSREVIVMDSVVNIKLYPVITNYSSPILSNCFLISTSDQTTSAWSKLEKENFNMGNIHNPYQLIRGRIPGLTISKPGGDPLGTFDVQQRGLHTILGSTEPLIVVNGLPGASLFSFDVQDIESMTVLRDAAMTSLYGTRGANGVILIETKKGAVWKKLNVQYSGYASIEKVSKTPDLLTASQFREVVNNSNSRFYNAAANLGASTDWAEAITRTGLSQAHNLSFSGRNKNTDYRLSLNYRDVNGVALKSGFDQTNVLLYLSQRLFKDKLQLQANGGITHRNFTAIDQDVFYQAAIYNPTAPIRTDTSSYGGYYQNQIFDYYNPVALLEQFSDQGEQNIYTANLNVNWDIIENVSAKVHYGWQQQADTRHYRVDKDVYYVGRLFDFNTKTDFSNQSLTTSLAYNFYKNDHEFNVTGGYQYQDWTSDAERATPYDSTITNVKINTKLAAFFANAQYNFRDWLFVNANWRREGSTRFGDNNKWGNFYGFGTGIDFAQLTRISFSDHLKLRVSYGVSGNLPVDGVYANRILGYGAAYLNNGKFLPTVIPSSNENQNLKWEERREWNWGLDFSFFNTQLRGSVELYNGRSTDLLFSHYVPSPPSLVNFQYENFIDFKNKGIELILDATVLRQGNFSWDVGLNYAKNRTEVDAISPTLGADFDEFIPYIYLGTPGGSGIDAIRVKEGEPLGALYGLVFDKFENGQAVFKDVNRDGRDCKCPADYASLGNAYPRFTMGLSNQFRWKALEASFFLRSVFGHKLVNAHLRRFGFWNSGNYNVASTAVEQKEETIPNRYDIQAENGTFVQLENVVIGYNFKAKKLSQLKVYAAAQNLFTLSGYNGIDPEVRLKNGLDYSANSLAPGFDSRMAYFPTRTFTLGVQAEF